MRVGRSLRFRLVDLEDAEETHRKFIAFRKQHGDCVDTFEFFYGARWMALLRGA